MNFYDILIMLAGEPTDLYQVILLKTFAGILSVLMFTGVLDLFRLIANMGNGGRR